MSKLRRVITGAAAGLLGAALIGAAPASAGIFPVYVNAGSATNCGTVVLSTPCLNLTQTWNAGAVTFTGIKLNVTDTASASGSLLMDLQVAGGSKFSVTKAGTVNTAQVNLFAAGFLSWNNDLLLNRDAANTLALRNAVNAQAFNIYNTFTDASNYERAVFGWNGVANRLQIGTQNAGTGTFRPLDIFGNSISIYPNGVGSNIARVDFSQSGWMGFEVDNAYDFGNPAANRPRNAYIGTRLNIAPKTVATLPTSPADGDRSFVTDATACTFAAAVTGGGAIHCPVYYDGGSSSWKAG